jgi:hypothetical protein
MSIPSFLWDNPYTRWAAEQQHLAIRHISGVHAREHPRGGGSRLGLR